MKCLDWKQLAIADAVDTRELLDGAGFTSHKVLQPEPGASIDCHLVEALTREYRKSLVDFNFAQVSYLSSQRFANLGVFAKKDLEVGVRIELAGFLARIPESCDLPENANVSVFKRNGEELMLGPLSFVNHSCWPNSVYVLEQDSLMSLRSLRTIKKGEEVTVKYGPEYFGDYNVDCLCPHTEFHGRGIVVLNSRTRSEARKTGEKGNVVEPSAVEKRQRVSLDPSIAPSKPCNLRQDSLMNSQKRSSDVVGKYCTSQGKKVRCFPKISRVCRNSSSESESSASPSCGSPENFAMGCNEVPDFDESLEPADAAVWCSTPLHLSCPLEFPETSNGFSISSDDSSSADDIALFEGAELSADDFKDLFYDFVVKHKLPDNAIKELLSLFKRLLPKPNNVPHNLHHRRTKIKKETDEFEVLEIRKQVCRIIRQNPDVFAELRTLTLFTNTDGASPFRSVKKTFWPFWALIDDLPFPRRTALQNMILVALWKGKSKPNFSVIGPPIKKELKDITSGLYCSELSRHFDVVLKDFICDMVAKAPSLNVVQFNGYFGCIYCYTRGLHENHRHLYPCQERMLKIQLLKMLVYSLT